MLLRFVRESDLSVYERLTIARSKSRRCPTSTWLRALPALLALDASIELCSATGVEIVPLADFPAGNYNPAVHNPGVYTYTVTGIAPCPSENSTVSSRLSPASSRSSWPASSSLRPPRPARG